MLCDLSVDPNPKKCPAYYVWLREELLRVGIKTIPLDQKGVTLRVPTSNKLEDDTNLRKRLAIPPRQTASIHILSSLAHRRFRMRRAPLSTTSAMTVPITKSGYEDPVHATSAPATITPALAITSFAEKI